MKNLILIRHAKSSWADPVGDKQRRLLPNGERDAALVAQKIAADLPANYQILSSTATRALQTARIFEKAIAPKTDIDFRDELYTFDAFRLEQIVRALPPDYDCVILFGHNEAITDFVNKFGSIYIDNVPTSGFVSLQFNVDDWGQIDAGRTDKVVFPRDLR